MLRQPDVTKQLNLDTLDCMEKKESCTHDCRSKQSKDSTPLSRAVVNKILRIDFTSSGLLIVTHTAAVSPLESKHVQIRLEFQDQQKTDLTLSSQA